MTIKSFGIIIFLWIFSLLSVKSQDNNPNLISQANGATFEASSIGQNAPWAVDPSNVMGDMLQFRWEAEKEVKGAWIKINWDKPQTLKELWIVTQATPFDFLLDPYMRAATYLIPKNVTIQFSDGSKMKITLKMAKYFQIVKLPKAITTNFLKITIDDIWAGSGENNTGLTKISAFGEQNKASFWTEDFQMYDVQKGNPVQSAKIRIVNPGNAIKGAKLKILNNGKDAGYLALNNIPENSVSIQQLWIPALFSDAKTSLSIINSPVEFNTQDINQKAYTKNYFDGSTFDIINTNHNDLGWLDIQSVTADYRSAELILPALELMKKYPDYKYMMESVEYLKEFLIRHPERREEMAQRMREGRFTWGASYVQNLEAHVGLEKLIRQFYYGKRWLRENFPGSDTKFYVSTDPPTLTGQLPQILKKSGIDYIYKGRFPYGFYYFEGLDGTSIPMYANRYNGPYGLISPKNDKGWLKSQNDKEEYFKSRQLKVPFAYDISSDYLPPIKDLVPFVYQQNKAMKEFSSIWNKHFKTEPDKQIIPPTMKFTEPEAYMKEVFGNGYLNVETIKGDWPLSWAYYDEPGHREGLLIGRKAHNDLLKAEGMHTSLSILNNKITYPKDKFEQGWLANCWPDHGWGGNRGIITDSFYVESYEKSLLIADSLVNSAKTDFAGLLPRQTKNQLPVAVYNSLNWIRTEVVNTKVKYPKEWNAFRLQDANGKIINMEVISQNKTTQTAEIAFIAENIPSFGYSTYYATAAESFPDSYAEHSGDSIETSRFEVKFGAGGISSLFDKEKKEEVLNTTKFFGGEIIQMTAVGLAWEALSEVNMNDFDKTSLHQFKTIRSVESPIRYIIEKEAKLKNFTLRQRFILYKHSEELQIEADIIDWTGEIGRELRMVFPVNIDKTFKASYEIPFGTVEVGKNDMDLSYLPKINDNMFVPSVYARKNLPYREAINWVDVSSGQYQGKGCLLTSDMTVHLFKDETANPVDYPVVQHVILSSRKSLAWNPDNNFSQAGSHSCKAAIFPHNGNWRFAYKNGIAFNRPLTAIVGLEDANSNQTIATSQSLISTEPSNIVVSAYKKAEDGNGSILRFYDAEGRFSTAKIKGFKPFSKVYLTDMIEYDVKELPVNSDGSVEIAVKPWEIFTIRFHY